MKMKYYFLAIAVIIFSSANYIYSQNTSQNATTEKGQSVVLYSDGTWKYATNAKSELNSGQNNSILTFDTGLVLKSGDVKPLARQKFYLLKIDVGDPTNTDSKKSTAVMEQLAQAYYGRDIPRYAEGYNKFMTVIENGATATTTSDFNGKGEFPAVPAGTYYIFGIGQIYKQVVVWNYKVDIKSGKNSVTLDQNNAAAIF